MSTMAIPRITLGTRAWLADLWLDGYDLRAEQCGDVWGIACVKHRWRTWFVAVGTQRDTEDLVESILGETEPFRD